MSAPPPETLQVMREAHQHTEHTGQPSQTVSQKAQKENAEPGREPRGDSQAKQDLSIPHLPQGPQDQAGMGSEQEAWQKHPRHKQARWPKARWGGREVPRGMGAAPTPELPLLLPALPTRPRHKPSNTRPTTARMFYTLRFLNSNKSAYILSEIHCLKYCTNQKSQVNCYILQILQNVTAIMSLSIICTKYFM